jgi:hypothetical protein
VEHGQSSRQGPVALTQPLPVDAGPAALGQTDQVGDPLEPQPGVEDQMMGQVMVQMAERLLIAWRPGAQPLELERPRALHQLRELARGSPAEPPV